MGKQSKTVLLAVTGGIAAYKACEVARLLVKGGFSVPVMMTESACKFVAPLTFQALTGRSVATDLFDPGQESSIGHIRLATEADVVAVAPATANVIAKAAHGICDDLVTTVLLAARAPIVMAPSMNVFMYENPVTRENIEKLKKRGVRIVDPEEGELACGWEGKGRLAAPEAIVAAVKAAVKV